MIRYILSAIFVPTLVGAEYDVSILKSSVWPISDSTWGFGGKCVFEVKQTYSKGSIQVDLVFDKSISDLEIWVMDISDSQGNTYKLENKYNVHTGSFEISFNLKYNGNSTTYPKGTCQSNLPSSGSTTQTTTTPTTSTTTSATTSTSTTTTPTTTATTTTATTTTPKPTSTTTVPTPSTSSSSLGCSSSNTGVSAPVVKVQDPWQSGDKWDFKGRCTFVISGSWAVGSILVDMCLDQPTSDIQIWIMNVNDNLNNGAKYLLSNKYTVGNQELSFEFIIKYTGTEESYPTGTCYSNLPTGATTVSTTSPTTSSTASTASTTVSPTSTKEPTTTSSASPTTTASTTTTSSAPTTTTASTTTTSGGSNQGDYDYSSVIEKSILFYEAQRSGTLWADNRIDWRGDSAVSDSGVNGEDLSGGWYDAGDHVKFNLPMSEAVTVLALGVSQWKDAYVSANQLEHMYDSIEWPLDYFMKCWPSSHDIYYAQVGNGGSDHAYWGRPEDMTMSRPAYYLQAGDSGSDVTGGTAGALAAGVLAFRNDYPTYAQKLLTNAESLYTFSKTILGTYGNSLPDSNTYYPSTKHYDDMCVSAALLYLATNNNQYKTEAIQFYNDYSPGTAWAFDWDDKTVLCQVLLYNITKDSTYKTRVEDFVSSYMPGGSVSYTDCGLAYRLQWAPNRYSANAAFIALLAADLGIGNPTTYKSWAMSQIHYMLGDNKLDMSYLIGYGDKYPQNPHHRSSSCPYPPGQCGWDFYWNVFPNSHDLIGALVGGPDSNDNFSDNRDNHQTNEVAVDYNAGFQSAVAALLHFDSNNDLPPAPTSNCGSNSRKK